MCSVPREFESKYETGQVAGEDPWFETGGAVKVGGGVKGFGWKEGL